MIEFTSSEISSYYAARLPGLKTGDPKQWRGKCPVHSGKDLNFSVNPDTGQAFCHSQCGRGWDIVSLEMELSGSDFVRAKQEVFRLLGRPDPIWQDRDIEATYDYTDEHGNLLYQVVRKTGKKFMQRRPVSDGTWIWGLGKVEPVPFQLPKLIKAHTCAVCEGEKDALNATRMGLVATCNNGGAGNFKPELVKWFTGKKVAIFADNDAPGRKHAQAVATLLHPVAASVRIVEIPGLELKGDISDFLAAGGTKEQIGEFYKAAPNWTPEFEYATEVPNENDKYVRTLAQYVDECGGHDAFWRTALHQGIPTPYQRLTTALGGGLLAEEVYVIGANSGAGKTSLALQFIIKALRSKYGVLLFSMEMPHKAAFQRMISIEARVDLSEFRKIQRSNPESPIAKQMRAALREYTTELSPYPLFVSTKSSVTPEYLVRESERLKARHKIDLIVVDHMQLMSGSEKEKSRGDYEKFTNISRGMKVIAKEMRVPVLLVSQTSRANSIDKRFELTVNDLRGSGAIGEDAAAVMLLYYDSEHVKQLQQTRSLHLGPVRSILKLDKNRYGPQQMCLDLLHHKTYTRFDEIEAAAIDIQGAA